MLKNLKLSSKLALAFGIVITGVLVVGATGYLNIADVSVVVADLTETHIPLLQVVSEIDLSATEQDLKVTQYAVHKDEALLVAFKEFDALVDKKFDEAKRLVEGDQELVDQGWLEPIERMISQHDIFVKSCNALISSIKAGKSYEEWDSIADDVEKQAQILMTYIDKLLELNDKEANNIAILAKRSSSTARNVIGLVGLFAIITSILLGFLITRSITKPINRVIDGLHEGAEQVTSASSQVSSASQSLAEGSSEQAASIEETSSSLEEMASMTKQNADNASQADNLMKEANTIVEKANTSMNELTTSMEEISKASEETSKIIKTIDEIAFQTNLLALNAAVEAARAGEAGAGFAVVADEVRNLAMRAAEAAKNTSNLIEGSVKKIQEGSNLVTATNEAFSEVSISAKKVGELVGEIAAASHEQSQGIEQVNKAVIEMDKVTQQNAANAEESASASEEMNAQAEQMMTYVNEMLSLVGGKIHNGNGYGNGRRRSANSQIITNEHDWKRLTGQKQALVPAIKAHAIHPEQVIPMETEEF